MWRKAMNLPMPLLKETFRTWSYDRISPVTFAIMRKGKLQCTYNNTPQRRHHCWLADTTHYLLKRSAAFKKSDCLVPDERPVAFRSPFHTGNIERKPESGT